MSGTSHPVVERAEQIQQVELSKLSRDDTQTRAALRHEAIEEYAEKIRACEEMDPALVFQEGEEFHLAAGFHRREAFRHAGFDKMPCIVRQGSRWEAIEAGLLDNQRHIGERLNRADKQHIIDLVLRERGQLSDRAIADLIGISDKTVAKYRRLLVTSAEIPQSVVRTGRDGRRFSVESRSADLFLPEPWLAPSETDTEHCSCSGLWVSDGHGQRYCESCLANHPWDQFPLPELQNAFRYDAPGTNDDSASLDPIPGAQPGFYVSRFRGLSENQADVVCTMRGVHADRQRIRQLLVKFGFNPSGPWQGTPASGTTPDYIPSEEQRWGVEERRKSLLAVTQ